MPKPTCQRRIPAAEHTHVTEQTQVDEIQLSIEALRTCRKAMNAMEVYLRNFQEPTGWPPSLTEQDIRDPQRFLNKAKEALGTIYDLADQALDTELTREEVVTIVKKMADLALPFLEVDPADYENVSTASEIPATARPATNQASPVPSSAGPNGVPLGHSTEVRALA
jgi:hypothetical protein